MADAFCLQAIISELEGEIISGNAEEAKPITGICASDLMSDVLSYSKSNYLLITSLVNLQTIRTAEITELSVICFVNNKLPGEEIIKLARNNNIILVCTALSMFEACGRLYGISRSEKLNTL